MEFLLILFLIALVIWGFSTSLVWGVGLLIAVSLYYYFKRYATLCMMMALRAYGKGDINGSFRWFERGEKKGYNTRQKITYAYYLMREGRVKRSEAMLDSVLACKIDKPELKYYAKTNHAILLLKTGRAQEALEELNEIFPYYKNSNIYGSLGYLHILCSDIETAEKFNLEAYDYNQEDAIILDNLVQLYTKMNQPEKAYVYSEKLMALNPGFIEAYYDAAVVEKALGKNDEAKEHLEHALTIRSSFISAVTHEDVQKLLDELEG